MSGINVSEGVQGLQNLGIKVNIRTGPRTEAVLKGIIMNPQVKDSTRAQALAELTALRQPVTAPVTEPTVTQ